MAGAFVVLLLLATLVSVGSCETLDDVSCLDHDADSTLLQMARLHKSIITAQDDKIAELRAQNEGQQEKIAMLEEGVRDLKETVAALLGRVSNTNSKLDALSEETRSSIEKLSSDLESVNSTLTEKTKDLVTEVGALKDEASSTQEDVEQLTESAITAGSDGKIAQSLLPGSYADYTLEHISWGSLHMAAAAACRGAIPSGGTGIWSNTVVPLTDGSSCTSTCAASNRPNCDSAVTLSGYNWHATKNLQTVGQYYNYGCHSTDSFTEMRKNEADILGNQEVYMTYCCCRK